ncbi:MAG: ABC transporter substrate-binding protein [Clostridia bacterium]|nr:ABC transporter substrate-binding protein [Clostridia bacterium]
MKKLFSVLLAVSMVVSLAACGQTAKNDTYTVGICQLVQHEALDAATKGFKDALTEELGDKVKFEEQNASGDSNACSTIINGFVSKNVDLIMANATPALQAASAGTSTIPILGTSVTEYGVALELDNFNGVVGGNISGTSDLAPLDKQAELLLSIFPDAKNVGLLYCSAEPNSIYQVKVVKEYLEGKGVTCKEFSFSDTNDIAAVTTSACKFSDVIYLPTDNQVAASTGIIDGICRPAKIPVISGEEGICAGCGVATLSISYYELGRKTGLMAARILRDGEDISKMPIEYDEDYKKKYNKEICDELGIKLPDDFEEIK